MSASPLDIPDLRSDRLSLQPLSNAHSEGMFALWSCPEVCRYSGIAKDNKGQLISLPARTAADSDKILQFFLKRATGGFAFRWALLKKDDGAFIGAAGFNSIGPCSEYAYHLHPTYWGNGLMTEASSIALGWLFSDPARKSAEAFVDQENVRSIRLAERLGFSPTDTIRDNARRYVVYA